MYVDTIESKQRGKIYRTVLVRESYREGGKVLHRTLANLSKLPEDAVGRIRRSLLGDGATTEPADLETTDSLEYGASFAFLSLARQIGLDKLLCSRPEQWRSDALAMVVGRIVYQGSKLALTNLSGLTALWELCGHEAGERPDVDRHCYGPLDRLLERQATIQKRIAAERLDNGCLVLYDITNTWLEGEYEHSELARYGRGKGGKHGYKQIAIGLVADRHGCPVAVDVFSGNTTDQTTVWDQARRLADEFGVSDVILAGDRGMLTPKRIEEVSAIGFSTLTALTHPQIEALLEKRVIQPELFDERGIAEVVDPQQPSVRYMLCKNPATMARERATRESMVEAVNRELDAIARVRRKRDPQKVCARVGRLFGKYPIGKFFSWEVSPCGELAFSIEQELIAREAALDGCYVVRTDVPASTLNTEEAVAGYRGLAEVEKAFRNLKTVAIEIRPVYHKSDRRIKAHVFLCFLAYYLLWHATERLKPLFDQDGEGADRRWSMPVVIETLKALRQETCLLDDVPVRMLRTRPNAKQAAILELLGVTWK